MTTVTHPYVLRDGCELTLEEKWTRIEPTLWKLLKQVDISRQEWHQLFWNAHDLIIWDEDAADFVVEKLTLTINGKHKRT